MNENGELLTIGTELGTAVGAIKVSQEVGTLCAAILKGKANLDVCFVGGVNAESVTDLKLGFVAGYNANAAKTPEVVDAAFDALCAVIKGVISLVAGVTAATEEDAIEVLPEVVVDAEGTEVTEQVAEDAPPVVAPVEEPAPVVEPVVEPVVVPEVVPAITPELPPETVVE